MDDDDKERSRGIPSRTQFGKRGSIIKEYPGLGEPLILLGGLITVPYWGYRNTPLAELEIMMADMPHVMYHYKQKLTDEEVRNRDIIANHQRELIKQGGLKALGLNLNFKKGVINGNELLAKKK